MLLVLALVPRVFLQVLRFSYLLKNRQFDRGFESHGFVSRRLLCATLIKQSQFIYLFILYLHWQYSTVQYSTVQYSTVQYSTVQYSTVQYSTVQYSTLQYSTAQHSTVQYSTVQYSTVQYSTMQYNTIQVYCVILSIFRCGVHKMTHQLVYRYST